LKENIWIMDSQVPWEDQDLMMETNPTLTTSAEPEEKEVTISTSTTMMQERPSSPLTM
jgi:hypothetical protein